MNKNVVIFLQCRSLPSFTIYSNEAHLSLFISQTGADIRMSFELESELESVFSFLFCFFL